MIQTLQQLKRCWWDAFRFVLIVVLTLGVIPQKCFAPTLVHSKITVPVTGNPIWQPLRDPTNPAKVITTNDGTVLAGDPCRSAFPPAVAVLCIPAIGSNARTATFEAHNLVQGYYKVEILYPKHTGNSDCVLVQYKRTADTGFTSITKRLNQQIDDLDTKLSQQFRYASTNVTPFKTSNAASYIWVANDSTGTSNTGRLAIRLNDGGCGSPSKPGGRIVADCIRLNLISTVK